MKVEKVQEVDVDDLDCAKRPWRPQPWGWLGDEFVAYMSISILLLISPLMAALIGTAEVTWAVWLFIKKHVSFAAFGSVINSVSETVGKKVLKDPRNAPYLPVLFWLGVWAPLIFAWAVYRYSQHGLEMWVVFVYHFLRIGPRFRNFAYFHVMAHKEGHDHRGFFVAPFTALNHTYVQWYLALFYGQVPNSYAVGHNKIHHRYNNELHDVHTCYDLDRSEPWSFLLYLPRFGAYWCGFSVFWHFMAKKEFRFAGRMLAGMVYYYAIVFAAMWYAWDFAICFLVFPLLESVVFFGGISYIWHSFLNLDDPENEYVNSVTVLNGHDNIFNEDYHVVHHNPNPFIHWTEYPDHFQKHYEEYKKHQATIFTDCEEGLLIYWTLSQKWDLLAEHFVDLNGVMNHEEKKALVLKRLRAIMKPKEEDQKAAPKGKTL